MLVNNKSNKYLHRIDPISSEYIPSVYSAIFIQYQIGRHRSDHEYCAPRPKRITGLGTFCIWQGDVWVIVSGLGLTVWRRMGSLFLAKCHLMQLRML